MGIEPDKLKKIVEGAIYAADKPLTLDNLKDLFFLDDQPTTEELKAAIEAIQQDYSDRGVELRLLASGYRFQVKAEVGPWVSRLWEEKPAKYSRALLETLALVAYRQPITRGEIEEIRGVTVSSYIVKTLMERDWVRVVGHRDVPGRPAMYATTKDFLDYFNLKNLDDLPSLAEIRDLDKINEELELVEKFSEDQAQEAAQEAESEQQDENTLNISNMDQTKAEGDNKKPHLTLHDLAEKMSRLRDDEVDVVDVVDVEERVDAENEEEIEHQSMEDDVSEPIETETDMASLESESVLEEEANRPPKSIFDDASEFEEQSEQGKSQDATNAGESEKIDSKLTVDDDL